MKEVAIVIVVIVAGLSAMPLCEDAREIAAYASGSTERYMREVFPAYDRQQLRRESGREFEEYEPTTADTMLNDPVLLDAGMSRSN